MGRPLDATTVTHTGDPAITVAYFIRLDILSDPLIAWTGWGTRLFGSGANLVQNGDMSSSTGWTLYGACTISGGKLNASVQTQLGGQSIVTAGKTYSFSLDYTCTAGSKLRLNNSTTNNANPVFTSGALTTTGATFTLTGTFTANATGPITVEADSANFTGTLDNFVVQEVGLTATGDGAFDGQSFDGVTHLVGEISAVVDSVGGSQSLELSLPGVDLNSEAMRQVVRDRRTWQFRQAWLWMAFLDDNMNIIGKPFRLKTGRMDQMLVTEDDNGTGTVKVTVESQQAYASEALNSRYSETKDLDATDTSQDFVWALANMQPNVGQKAALEALRHDGIPGNYRAALAAQAAGG